MKIDKKHIGSRMFSRLLGQTIVIEEGNEALYEKLGFDVFEKEQPAKGSATNKGKRNKGKEDASDKKTTSEQPGGHSDGTDDASES